MATPATNRAVALYRQIRLKELNIEDMEQTLNGQVRNLEVMELKDYVDMTEEIDLAAGHNNATLRAAIRGAGLDWSKL